MQLGIFTSRLQRGHEFAQLSMFDQVFQNMTVWVGTQLRSCWSKFSKMDQVDLSVTSWVQEGHNYDHV
jgi:hypothetical protein